MISIHVYDRVNMADETKELDTQHFEETRRINDYDEKLETWVMKNEVSPTGYRNFRVITDEVYNQKVRVKGEVIDQVIQQELHLAYVKVAKGLREGEGNLVTLCKKEDSYKVKEIFEDRFDLEFSPHTFNILDIIEASADVRNAKFDVQIETVNGVSMKGTRVHDTQYYANMMNSGDLKAVIVNYDMPDKTVTFRISVEGSILMYNGLSDYEILQLIDDLLNI